ncbi:DUF2510 domain-containing protein [Streptomyces longisporoflavus]|uniref:DUF2510 domain-containing protein n=1 Tax=Streptomyces longisporoflavus TaxID=28044 RepID=A0ABW7QX11_9ACTN
MTQVTPPGWYPDPGQTNDGPRTERWWDGNVWTDQVRAVGSAAGWGSGPTTPAAPTTSAAPTTPAAPTAPPAYPPTAPTGVPAGAPGSYPGAYPDYPSYPGQPTAPKRGLRTGIAIGAALVVLAGIGGGVYFLTSDDGDGDGGSDNAAKPPASSAPAKPGDPQNPQDPEQSQPPGGGPSDIPGGDGKYVPDRLSGLSLPVPDDWTGSSGEQGGAAVTTGPYPCPGETDKTCSRGGAYLGLAKGFENDEKTAEAAAKADIAANAKESYGGKTYGKITSHKELESKAVTVAGQKGYLVRWKAVTEKSDDGYVQSLAFPSPVMKSELVIVRFGIDVNDKSPKLSVMDEITKGIKVASGGGGGNGKEV